jgi:hypothetical protein
VPCRAHNSSACQLAPRLDGRLDQEGVDLAIL